MRTKFDDKKDTPRTDKTKFSEAAEDSGASIQTSHMRSQDSHSWISEIGLCFERQAKGFSDNDDQRDGPRSFAANRYSPTLNNYEQKPSN